MTAPKSTAETKITTSDTAAVIVARRGQNRASNRLAICGSTRTKPYSPYGFSWKARASAPPNGYGPYQSSIPLTFSFDVDFAQLIKRYGGSSDTEPHRKYSPANITSVDSTIGCGNPDESRICTSHVERQNLTMRMQIRRLTRLTNAHSKSQRHHKAMLALYFSWYNFVRKHSTIGTTPAAEHGIVDHEWTIEELLYEAAKSATQS